MRAAILLLALAAVAAAPPWPARSRWPVGRSVTRVEGPIDEAGYIDYTAALNARLRRGVTPENNAAVLLWQAVGPKPEGAAMPDGYFAEMGMKPPPEAGEYLIPMGRFAQERLKLVGEDLNAFLEEMPTSRAWRTKDHPRFAAWLKANEKPLAVVVAATKRTEYYLPLVPTVRDGKSSGLLGALLPSVQRCREAAAALVARALLKAGEGDAAGGWQDLLAAHRLGRLVGRGGTLIEALVGFAIESIAANADVAFLDRTRPDAKTLAGYDRDLRALPAPAAVADKVDLTERLVFLDIVQMVDRHGPRYLGNLSGGGMSEETMLERLWRPKIDYTPAMRAGNEVYDRLSAAMRRPRDERRGIADQIDRELHARRARAASSMKGLFGSPTARGEQMANILVGLLIPATGKVQDADDRLRQVRDNLLTAVALERYHREHGRYPKELSALAPKYLPRVPADLFSDEGLRYKAEGKGYVLYSVGLNGRDDGGRGYADDPRGDDLVVRMPLKAKE